MTKSRPKTRVLVVLSGDYHLQGAWWDKLRECPYDVSGATYLYESDLELIRKNWSKFAKENPDMPGIYIVKNSVPTMPTIVEGEVRIFIPSEEAMMLEKVLLQEYKEMHKWFKWW